MEVSMREGVSVADGGPCVWRMESQWGSWSKEGGELASQQEMGWGCMRKGLLVRAISDVGVLDQAQRDAASGQTGSFRIVRIL
eukprot:366147-Chlamydomonas_euryale.AAC.10